ncbi:MAG: sulfide/dihydroorotate dehydrogenase-like FAD/NAD-binding protein [Clostridia bacterium]|nr:sulfide/dihydroorotate dehydrogenase-like FAD/NAD-binding protein [Clostridia bacterium]
MFTIASKRVLNEQTTQMEIEAPLIAEKALPGQFIIFRIDEKGERVPLTIADTNVEKGTATIIFQAVGKSTACLAAMNEGDALLDFVGPLGTPTHLDGFKRVAVLGGGLGTAIAYPQAKYLHTHGCEVHSIVGFRNKELIILEDEVRAVSDQVFVMTDDGSNGNQGFVTAALEEQIKKGVEYDMVIAIGPLPMMRAVCNLTKPYAIKTIISMNSIMIDGTGMCGGCRLIVDGKVKFACVDGPDFDGHLVDFDAAMKRNAMYRNFEAKSLENHKCRLEGMNNA